MDENEEEKRCFSFKLFWKYAGPGWLMTLAYVDPGNLESDLQSGAYTGYELIWVVLASTLAGLVFQILAVRLGTVTGKHLAQVCAAEYSRPKAILLWIMAEIAIIGSDIQEVIGSAIALRILFNIPLWVGCLITGIDTFTFLVLHAAGMRTLEAFFCMIIGTMSVCFLIDFGASDTPPSRIIQGLVPQLHSYSTVQAVGTIGAIIMPHNLFLHSALVQAREVKSDKLRQANKYFAIESSVALLFSFIINVSVICVFATAFFNSNCAQTPHVQTACVPFSNRPIYDFHDGTICPVLNGTIPASCPTCILSSTKTHGYCQSIGLSDAGDAISHVLGTSARTVWAIGLLASGQASTMTGTFAGQYVMQGFLDIQIVAWKRVALTRSLALVPAVAVAMLSKIEETESDRFDEWLNVLQSIQLPFAIIPLVLFTSNQRIMGEYANSFRTTVLVGCLAILLLGINCYLVVKFLGRIGSMVVFLFFTVYLVFLGTILAPKVHRSTTFPEESLEDSLLKNQV